MANILIVEDNVTQRRILSYTLRKHGHSVVQARDGHEALHQLANAEVAMAFVDFAMPEMDGLTLLHTLRADARYRALPVVMLTASGLDEDRQAAELEGVNCFLTKPISSHELIDAVDQFVFGARRADSWPGAGMARLD